MFTITILYRFSVSSSFLIFFSDILFFVMSHDANDENVDPAVSSSKVEGTSQVEGTNAASNTRVTDIEINREVTSGSFGEY